MRIKIPSSLSGLNLNLLLDQMLILGGSSTHQIEIDFNRLGFIYPREVVSLSNFVRHLQNKGKKVIPIINTLNLENNQDSPIKYLDDCLFFEKHFGQKLLIKNHSQRLTNGLELIDRRCFPAGYIKDTINWLRYSFDLKEKQFGELSTSLAEVFNNICDHSFASEACCFAQHYPNLRKIRLAISDFGVGIPVTIRRVLPHIISDAEAVKQATLRQISGKSKPNNSGAGLPTIIDLIGYNKGALAIHSGNGHFIVDSNKKRVYDSEAERYPGTLITMEFRTDRLVEDDDINGTEGFEW